MSELTTWKKVLEINDYKLNSCIPVDKSKNLITGRTLRMSGPNFPLRDNQTGHEFMDRWLKTG